MDLNCFLFYIFVVPQDMLQIKKNVYLNIKYIKDSTTISIQIYSISVRLFIVKFQKSLQVLYKALIMKPKFQTAVLNVVFGQVTSQEFI